MDMRELYEWERSALREELRGLKACQVTFLTSSVTATGVLLGLTSALAKSPIPKVGPGVAFFFPLVVLIPSWWIFFDKATTITRIVGYSRILEGLLVSGWQARNFLGWERALEAFRNEQGKLAPELLAQQRVRVPGRLGKLLIPFAIKTTAGYWVTCYWVFCALSGLCVVAGCVGIPKDTWLVVLPMLASVAIFLVSYYWIAWILWQLVRGRHSYNLNESIWASVLKVEKPKEDGQTAEEKNLRRL